MYYTERINETMIKDFEKLTYLEYRSALLYKVGDESPVVAFGAFSYPAQPIGLILGELKKDGYMQIHTIFIKPKYRGQGVATALIKDMEQVTLANKCHGIYFGFIHDNSYHEIFTRLLQKCCWDLPAVTDMLLYSLDMENLVEEDAPQFTLMELPVDYTVSSWEELSEQDFAELKKGCGNLYPELTSPFLEEERVDPLNSVFLRDENQKIIGWTITHRLNSETMLYRNVFVIKEFQSMGYAMLLMAHAIWRQYDRGIYKLMFCVHVKNKSMNRIVSRFMKPFNHTVKKKLRYSKSFI